jgi:hypothetical protein
MVPVHGKITLLTSGRLVLLAIIPGVLVGEQVLSIIFELMNWRRKPKVKIQNSSRLLPVLPGLSISSKLRQ